MKCDHVTILEAKPECGCTAESLRIKCPTEATFEISIDRSTPHIYSCDLHIIHFLDLCGICEVTRLTKW